MVQPCAKLIKTIYDNNSGTGQLFKSCKFFKFRTGMSVCYYRFTNIFRDISDSPVFP